MREIRSKLFINIIVMNVMNVKKDMMNTCEYFMSWIWNVIFFIILRKKYLNDKFESYMAHWRSPEFYWLKLNMHIMAYKGENKSYETWARNSARSNIIKREKQKVETRCTAFNEDLIINYGSLEIQFVPVSKRTSIIVKRLFDQIIGFWLYFKNIEFSNY